MINTNSAYKIVDGNLEFSFKKQPVEYAEDAFRKGYYIEALQLFYSWSEAQMQQLLLIAEHPMALRTTFAERFDVSNNLSYSSLVKVLFILGLISKSQKRRLENLSKFRNKMIHRMFFENYDGQRQAINMKEFEEIIGSMQLIANDFVEIECSV